MIRLRSSVSKLGALFRAHEFERFGSVLSELSRLTPRRVIVLDMYHSHAFFYRVVSFQMQN